MSGLAGILLRRDDRSAVAADIQRMLARLHHRARDGSSWWTDAGVALGNAWFNTTDEPGPGPLTMAAGKLAVTADCRLDNRDELAARLGLGDGSTGDTMLVMQAYLRWGEDCPSHLQGDFAFAIWDGERRALFCARDHFGVKPFYYHSSGERFAFASEIGPILALEGVGTGLSEHQISGFLAGLPDDPQSTHYADIFRLPARHSLTAMEGRLTLRCYWQLQASPRPPRADAAEEFAHLFSRSVQNRMRGTPAVGAMLSGGLDSSSIACVAAERKPGLRTFSLVFEKGSPMDEKPFIDAVLDQRPVDGTLIGVGDYAPFAEFERILEEQEGTFLAPGLSLTRSIYRTAGSKGVKVLLDGHGGDEVVSQGHGLLHELADAGRWTELWRELRGASATYGEGMLAMYCKFLARYGPARRIAKLKGRSNRALARLLGRPPQPREPAWGRLVNPDLARRTDLADRFHRAGAMPAGVSANEALTHRWILSSGLVPHAFEVLDKAAANFGVEPRYPFWDKPLVEFCLALPGEEKLRNGFGRYVLRRAMEGVLPPVVQWRRDKIDFTANLVNGMLGNHRELLDKVLVCDGGRIAPYVNLPEVTAAYARLLRQPERASPRDVQYVWRSTSLSLWLRQIQNSGNVA
ncbi:MULTISPECIES: lasso peptide isopeptide bond-forming cyclase [unclassified Mesorhizobium]|uniref:lasso peptide isopeptide bond-forming cyclase n=1 Tax=unclassified Mesorhizobium TaxID=325217 RepID=UPI000F74DE2E|nr:MULTISPECIES: lasso peptide isopeptide bond-forming cyclase [unclassified Mesorhizobium]TGT60837.1 lasso peptide isopeptide bond-forming cyclase [Mesorhizobium sp. M00.F.Ca.ET.170.01.1.1]AZO10063.1 lasso peptide isopeptide bond-forming cyclase [Mesorhizobium sp. M3A.F.Ca.ET.080.04.2.1]RWB75749.1 MAG: lasso peptide isopeptide bond-forming cyclase [Mesorhizobium sp.]RWB91501.1 MAG: lasso peptide isopeptide bond-forming cyclase [Mesorhizobium sp.]RWE21262.1 MAG: lasso peptide isopeptide bond-f